MARHMTDQDSPDVEFLKRVEKRVEALNHATVAIAPERMGRLEKRETASLSLW